MPLTTAGSWERSAARSRVSSTASSRTYTTEVPVSYAITPTSTTLKPLRQPGQGGSADTQKRDLRAQLLEAEAAHISAHNGMEISAGKSMASSVAPKRPLQGDHSNIGHSTEDLDAKRRRVLEETRAIDADTSGSESDSSDDER
jgi:protein CWC15